MVKYGLSWLIDSMRSPGLQINNRSQLAPLLFGRSWPRPKRWCGPESRDRRTQTKSHRPQTRKRHQTRTRQSARVGEKKLSCWGDWGLCWSGRGDLNPRPPEPHSGTLPGCATARLGVDRTTRGIANGWGRDVFRLALAGQLVSGGWNAGAGLRRPSGRPTGVRVRRCCRLRPPCAGGGRSGRGTARSRR
jgi:hypothetical protein